MDTDDWRVSIVVLGALDTWRENIYIALFLGSGMPDCDNDSGGTSNADFPAPK
jgi:hypothetical protein